MDTIRHGTSGALIIGGAHGALAMARSLGRRSIPVGFITSDNVIVKFSRYVSLSEDWPGPTEPDAAKHLFDIGRRYNLAGWLLLPGGDAEAELISHHRSELASFFRIVTPDWETARWALDKHLTYERAAALGIAYPRSYAVSARKSVDQLDCRFPLVLKPATHREINALTVAKAWRINNRAELLACYDKAVIAAGEKEIVLQELIPGSGDAQFSYAAIWNRGQPIASLVAQRTRQFPIEFGYSSTFVETVENAAVEEAAVRFLKSLDYSGLVEIEFKFDARTGRYNILDVNIRAWTWIALGHRAGIDFPYLQWRLSNGEPVAPFKARTGVAWTHLSRDVVAALQEIRAKRISPTDYLGVPRRSIEFAAFAWDDPLPGILDLPLVAVRVLKRRLPNVIGTLKAGLAQWGKAQASYLTRRTGQLR